MLSEKLVNELGVILKEECSIQLPYSELSKFANDLRNYFQILLEIKREQKYENKQS